MNVTKILLCLLTAAQLALTSTETLEQVQSLYERGEYKKADILIDEVLAEDGVELEQEEELEFFVYKARIAFAFSNTELMQQWLRSIYEIDPDYELDPIQDPPEAIEYFASLSKTKKPKQQTKDENWQERFRKTEESVKRPVKFWIKTIPFGVGHFDSNQLGKGLGFLTAELAFLVWAADLSKREKKHSERMGESDASVDVSYNSAIIGTMGFLGVWGYELSDMYPLLYKDDPSVAEGFRFGLSFAPLGVGQYKNGQVGKAWALGSIQLLGLLIAGNVNASQTTRNIASTIAGGAMIYGAVDGWLYHEYKPVGEKNKSDAASLRLMPSPFVMTDNRFGLSLHVQVAF